MAFHFESFLFALLEPFSCAETNTIYGNQREEKGLPGPGFALVICQGIISYVGGRGLEIIKRAQFLKGPSEPLLLYCLNKSTKINFQEVNS